jgi:hypothetical protein
MFTTIAIIALAALTAIMALIPLKAGAAYRFRGKQLLLIEGLGLLACAVLGVLTWNVWLLAGSSLVGLGISQLPNSHKRLE